MKREKNVIVVGAGIMGLMAAFEAQRRGYNITVFDSNGFPPKNSASFKAGGMIAPYAEIEHMDENWLAMGVYSINLWSDIISSIGTPDLFFQEGSLIIAHPDDAHMLARFKQHLPNDHVWHDVIPQTYERHLPDKFKTGIFLQNEAHLYPQEFMYALCTYLNKKNVHFERTCFDLSEPHNYDHIIDCSGITAAQHDKNLRGVKGELLYVYNREFSLLRPVRFMHPRYPLYIVPRQNHIFMIGATNIESADEHVTLRSAMELMSALYALHPSFSEAHVLELTAGVRPTYPDNLPRITVNGKNISCNGSYRHGYLLSPVMAQATMDIIDGIENPYLSMLKDRT